MSHAIGAVRFNDGKILYYEYNGTSDVVIDKLWETPEEVNKNWRKYIQTNCDFKDDEPVEIMTTYGGGFYWSGRACRTHMTITGGYDPFEVKHENGHPWWSPWWEHTDGELCLNNPCCEECYK